LDRAVAAHLRHARGKSPRFLARRYLRSINERGSRAWRTKTPKVPTPRPLHLGPPGSTAALLCAQFVHPFIRPEIRQPPHHAVAVLKIRGQTGVILPSPRRQSSPHPGSGPGDRSLRVGDEVEVRLHRVQRRTRLLSRTLGVDSSTRQPIPYPPASSHLFT
jgi:hypothetical protein